ncbi:hypothetical protein LOTGIDRAFT_179932 [Lottia gigantea]|uniref:Arginine kinase n=1 Tax=Lottia gigantea TaxID=225164 RepID=V3ZID8_LOTGI|nr:hypothetical protein LOTGIDRAFT_179932 [Lottia gigantea]ESO82080.1 hypothetical protein LOTGIDRAFT_179932 [Lottia gigantea]
MEFPNPKYDLIMDEDLKKNKWPSHLDGKDSDIIALEVTGKREFEKYCNLKTKGGWSLARAINTGVMNPTSLIGCHAGDAESYSLFGDVLFNKVIKRYHDGYNVTKRKHVTNINADEITTKWTAHSKEHILSSRVRVARNIASFPLNPTGSKESRLAICDLMERLFQNLQGGLTGKFYRHTEMSIDEQQYLVDKHYLFRGGDRMQAASGYHQHWPHGRGIFISDSELFLVWVNEGDHLRIMSLETGADIEGVFRRLFRGVKQLEEQIKIELAVESAFWFTPSHGHLTCCPSNLGTGMRASVHILLPNVLKLLSKADLDKIARKYSCQVRGSFGEHSKLIDRLDISNWIRLGRSEIELVQDMILCVNNLIELNEYIVDSNESK